MNFTANDVLALVAILAVALVISARIATCVSIGTCH